MMLCRSTIPSEQNGNSVGSIQMKRVPCLFSFPFSQSVYMFAVVSTLSMGFKSTYRCECTFISVNLVSFGFWLHDAILAKSTGNLILQSSYLFQSCNVQPFKLCIICVCGVYSSLSSKRYLHTKCYSFLCLMKFSCCLLYHIILITLRV